MKVRFSTEFCSKTVFSNKFCSNSYFEKEAIDQQQLFINTHYILQIIFDGLWKIYIFRFVVVVVVVVFVAVVAVAVVVGVFVVVVRNFFKNIRGNRRVFV
jgi:hypothetical protein